VRDPGHLPVPPERHDEVGALRRTIGSSASERAFQASQSAFTFHHTRLTVSLPTAPTIR
jgi:2'-5' RNA ligase